MFGRILGFIGSLVLQLLRGIGHAVAETLRTLLYRAGRFLGRLVIWAVGAAVVLWLIQSQPEMVGQLLGIGILIWVIYWMVTSPFRKKRRK